MLGSPMLLDAVTFGASAHRRTAIYTNALLPCEVEGLLQRIDAALATAPVKADQREQERLQRWRRELLLSLADSRRAEWGD